MARNIVIVLICAVVVFGLVWKVAPDILATALPMIASASADDTIGEATEPEEPAKKAVSPKTPTRGHKAEATASVRAAENEAVALSNSDASPAAAAGELAPAYVDPTKPRVLAESASLYSSNGPSGRVLRVLKRNDVLELHFKVDNGGQEWMFVNVPDQRVSGFLSTDSVSQ